MGQDFTFEAEINLRMQCKSKVCPQLTVKKSTRSSSIQMAHEYPRPLL